jgi:transcription elongation factor Elf1
MALCEVLSNCRNEELHSGGLPFETLPKDWLSRFYSTCHVFLSFQKRSLLDFLGEDEAVAAKRMIEASQQQVLEKVRKSISAHKTTFEEKNPKEKKALLGKSDSSAKLMAYQGGHRVTCPACGAKSWVTGEKVRGQETKFEKTQIVERTAMLPTRFECIACGLKLTGHAELHVAGIGGQFTRSRSYDPFSYYADMYEEYPGEEYNNE